MGEEAQGSILICRDAAKAGRMLLARNDLRIRWALTAPEAEAVINLTRCAVVVTREALAKPVLAACAKAGRSIETIVLLEPENWGAWRDFFEMGATSVLQSTATDDLLDALAEATGLSFRSARRAPYKTTVRFALEPDGGTWTSLNLSTSGICLINFPPYALGSEVDIELELGGKMFEVNAIVAQVLRVGGARAVGLAFRDVGPRLRTYLEETIRETERRSERDQPIDEFDALDAMDESTIMALRSSHVRGNTLELMRALTSQSAVSSADSAAPWLRLACEALSPLEVQALQNPKLAPGWAHDAVMARLRVFQVRSRTGDDPVSENDTREILSLCSRLSERAAGSDDESLVQLTNIRADILRTLYDPNYVEI